MRRYAVALLGLSVTASAQWTEPLDVRNHRAADLAFLRLTPRAGLTPQGARTFSYSLAVANEFRRSGLIDEDSETWRALFDYREGLGGGWEAFFEVPLISRGGGLLDPVIDWWHGSVLGQPDPAREGSSEGRSVVQFPGGGPYGSATGIGDVTVGVGRKVLDSLTARAAVKVPTGDASNLMGSGAFDAALGTDLRWSFGHSLVLDLSASTVLQGSPTHLDGARQTVLASSVTLTWMATSRDAWTVQWSSEQAPTHTGAKLLDKDHRVVSFGYQRRIDRSTVLQLYISEDGDFRLSRFPGSATVGPDLTIGVRFVQKK